MSEFSRAALLLGSEGLEKLEKARVEYDISEDREMINSRDVTYIIRVKSSDLKKVS